MYPMNAASHPPTRHIIAQQPTLLSAGAFAATSSATSFPGEGRKSPKDAAAGQQQRAPLRSLGGASATRASVGVSCATGQLGQRRPTPGAGFAPSLPAAGMRAAGIQQRPQACEDSELLAFLAEAGFQEYATRLIQNGFDDMETLLQIEDVDMKDLGIPPHKVLRLRRKLQEIQGNRIGDGEPDASHPVVAFLEHIGLVQYARNLLQNGFDEMETLLEMDDLDMKDIGIARGHALKLKKRLHEHHLQQCEQEQPEFLQATNRRTLQHLRSPPPACRSLPPTMAPATFRPPAAVRAPVMAAAVQALPTEQAKSAVARSWEQVQVLGAFTVGELLYRHTFALAPEAVELFPPEVRAKYRIWSDGGEISDSGEDSDAWESKALRNLFAKVINAVGCTVAGLHDFSKLVPMLTKLGARHLGYRVPEASWQILGKALDLTLSEILGEAYTQEVQSAWTMVYAFMSNIMIEGLRAAKHEQAASGALEFDKAEVVGGSAERKDEDTVSQVSSTVGHRSVSEVWAEETERSPSSMRSQ